MNICPVCGYPGLREPAWNPSPSYEICSSCGVEYGYQDAAPTVTEREARWVELRNKWIENGMKWHSKVDGIPEGWNPAEQLKKIQQ